MNLLILQLVPENVRGIEKLAAFVRTIMGQRAEVLNQDATMKKFQQRILDVLGSLKVLDVLNVQMIQRQCLLKITLS